MQQYDFQSAAGSVSDVDSPVNKAIGARIRLKRKELKLKQDELAQLVSEPTDYVSKRERGEMGLAREALLRYASALQVTPEWLAGRPGDPRQRRAPAAEQRSERAVLKPIVELMNAGVAMPLTSEELQHVTRYLDDGGSQEPIDMEAELLSFRAKRDMTDESIAAFRAALVRKRKLQTKKPSGDSATKSDNPEHPH
jgi:transcriptional regulator with XRE-family HTH domain